MMIRDLNEFQVCDKSYAGRRYVRISELQKSEIGNDRAKKPKKIDPHISYAYYG
jgi:hypothetical protein